MSIAKRPCRAPLPIRSIRAPVMPSARGFTLIELMIVVAVVAIIAAIAIPNYNEAVRKSRRGQAKADIAEYAQMAERFHTINNTYVGFGLPFPVSPREGGTARYTLAIDPQTQNTFTITATVAAGGGQDQDECGNLGISSTGAKTHSKGTLVRCW
jgi:type IV pilus assembly protein PilE